MQQILPQNVFLAVLFIRGHHSEQTKTEHNVQPQDYKATELTQPSSFLLTSFENSQNMTSRTGLEPYLPIFVSKVYSIGLNYKGGGGCHDGCIADPGWYPTMWVEGGDEIMSMAKNTVFQVVHTKTGCDFQ